MTLPAASSAVTRGMHPFIRSRARDGQLTKWIAAVDEEPGICCSPSGDTPQHSVTGLGVTPIERADADGEHDVVRLLVGVQDEVFGRDATEAHAAGSDLLCCDGLCSGDGGRRPVDGQYVAGCETGCDRSCGRGGPASEFEDAGVRLKRKCVHDRLKTGRQRSRHARRITTAPPWPYAVLGRPDRPPGTHVRICR